MKKRASHVEASFSFRSELEGLWSVGSWYVFGIILVFLFLSECLTDTKTDKRKICDDVHVDASFLRELA